MIAQVYIPTNDGADEEIEQMYEKIKNLINQHLVVMGGWNAVIEEKEYGSVVGKFHLRRKK